MSQSPNRDRSAALKAELPAVLALAFAFAVLAGISILLSRFGNGIAGLWLPNLLVIGILLRFGRPAFATTCVAIFAASMVCNMAGGSSPLVAAVFSIVNLAHIALAVALSERLVGPRPIRDVSLSDFAKLVVAIGGVATLAAALMFGALVSTMAEWPFASSVEKWFSANALGAALLLPVLLLSSRPAWRALLQPQAVARITLVGAVSIAGVAAALTWGQFGFILAMLPLLLAVARMPLLELVLVAGLTGATAIGLAMSGAVPGLGAGISAFSQGFQASLSMTMLMPVFGGLLVRQILDDSARIAASEKRFRKAMQDAAIGIALIDLDGRIQQANNSFASMLGYGPHELDGKSLLELTCPEDMELSEQTMQRIRSGELRSYHLEKRYLHRNGTPIWTDLAGSVIDDEETGRPLYLISQIVDIDTRKRSDALLAEAETRWNFALATAGQGMWDLDMRSGKTTYSATWKAMLGYEATELDGDPDRWLTLVHPDDMARVVEADRRLHQGESETFEAEFRMQHKAGHWIWLLDRGRALERKPDGTILRAIGTMTDITARKRSEARLAQYAMLLEAEKERLRVTLRSIGDAVICTDASDRITFMNPVAESLLGLSAADALNRPLPAIYVRHHEETGDPLRLPAGDETADGRALLVRRDGSHRHIREVVSTIIDAGGTQAGLVIVFQDVTDARTLQRELAYAAAHDALTGLANRSSFLSAIGMLIGEAAPRDQHQLLYIDLDRFKQVNDTSGHAAGDALLGRVSDAIRGAVRDKDFVARIGGDEFAALLKDCPPSVGMIIAQNLVATIGSIAFEWDGRSHEIGASVGLASIRPGVDDADEIMARADRACYAAKASGRGRAVAADFGAETPEAAIGG